jgi:hypothetical protein
MVNSLRTPRKSGCRLWRMTLCPRMTSGSDDNTYIVHPIPWRTTYVNTMFDRIDKYNAAKKSSQARRQMKSRVIGAPSSRPIPTGDFPEWAVKQDTA